jgi:hypothetical protein
MFLVDGWECGVALYLAPWISRRPLELSVCIVPSNLFLHRKFNRLICNKHLTVPPFIILSHASTAPRLTTSILLSGSKSASTSIIPSTNPLTTVFCSIIRQSTPRNHSPGKYCLHTGRWTETEWECDGPRPIYDLVWSF